MVLVQRQVVADYLQRPDVLEAHAADERQFHIEHAVFLLALQYEIHVREDGHVFVRHGYAKLVCEPLFQVY